MYFCAAHLEKDQTKRGLDALHPFLHSSSLRGNRWRDGPRLRHCSVDAEHLVTSSIFWGSTGRLIRTLTHELSIWAWGFMPHTWTPQNPSRKDPRSLSSFRGLRPSLDAPPKGGFCLTSKERRGYKNDSHSLMVVPSKYSFEFG